MEGGKSWYCYYRLDSRRCWSYLLDVLVLHGGEAVRDDAEVDVSAELGDKERLLRRVLFGVLLEVVLTDPPLHMSVYAGELRHTVVVRMRTKDAEGHVLG